MSGDSLKTFLKTVAKSGTIVKSKFKVEVFTAGIPIQPDNKLSFYITDINIPGNKVTQNIVYYLGREYDIPIVYNFDRDFTLTVLANSNLSIYKWFSNKMLPGGEDYDKHKLRSQQFDIKVSSLDSAGYALTLKNCYFKTLSELSFSNGDKELLTFTVSGFTREINITSGNGIFSNLPFNL